MATPQELVEGINTLVLEVEKVVAAEETPSTEQILAAEDTAAEESEENKSYVRGYNGKHSSSPEHEEILTTCRCTQGHASCNRD